MGEKNLKIGNLEFATHTSLAPMAGITDSPFRQIIRGYSKNCLVYTEMLSSEALMWNKEQAIINSEEIEKPIVYQIVGHKPDLMSAAAKKIENQATIVDINMGCPVNKIVKSQDGSGLMKNPSLAYDVVQAVKDATNKPVSVKFRLGWDFNTKNYIKFGEYMQEAGAAMLTLHGRTRSQMYSGVSDWNAIRELKSSVDIPVFANGDINSLEKAIECKKMTNCDGLMIGRGILGNPDLIYRIENYFKTGEILPEAKLEEKIAVLKKHIIKEIEYRGELSGLKFMRKFYAHYIKGVKNAASLRDLLVREENTERIMNILDGISQNG